MPSPRPFPNNLPVTLSSFIGRGREIEAVKRRLGEARLVTLTGPGGSGKTRLALWVAAEVGSGLAHGAWLVELAALSDPALVASTVAHGLGLREQPGRPALDQLAEYLAERELLLVLDNCEHLIAASAALAEALLRAAPSLRLLATSREPLNIPGEAVWPVPALSLPAAEASAPAPTLAAQSEAVRLFVERAAAAVPGFSLTGHNAAAVAQICRQVDGLPLAVELAAARVRALTVEQIAARLAHPDPLRLLSAGHRTAPLRQQTLTATLDWSYALLDDDERRALRRLSVFAGGWTLEAAEVVVSGQWTVDGKTSPERASHYPLTTDHYLLTTIELLARLVDKSLVTADQAAGETRYRLLETIRQYAHARLVEAGELDQTRNAHLAYWVHWAEAAEPNLYGPRQLETLQRYSSDHDNLRAALEWAGHRADPEAAALGLRLAKACGRYWRQHGIFSEGRAHLLAALARSERYPAADALTATQARAWFFAGLLAYMQSDYPASRAATETSLALYHRLGPAPTGIADTLGLLGEIATEEGDYISAPALFEQALALWRAAGYARGSADMLAQLGWVSLRTGDHALADARLAEAQTLFRQLDDTAGLAICLAGQGEAALRGGHYARAQALLDECLALRRRAGDRWGLGTSFGALGWLAQRQGDLPRMRAALAQSLAVRQEIGDKSGIAWCLEKLAESLAEPVGDHPLEASGALLADLQRAARIFSAAAALRAPLHSVIDPADQPEYDRQLAALRAALGDDAFDAAWGEGAGLPLAAAIAAALAEPVWERAAPAKSEDYGGLSPRERDVAALLAQGKSNREIAAALVVGPRTAETYISRILNKLGFSSRVQIATWAIEKGLAPRKE